MQNQKIDCYSYLSFRYIDKKLLSSHNIWFERPRNNSPLTYEQLIAEVKVERYINKLLINMFSSYECEESMPWVSTLV